jgi:PhoH-like ATPase
MGCSQVIHSMENTISSVQSSPQQYVEVRVKTYVLDTNVLLHDPQSIYKFEDNNLAIPVEVLEELDAIKSEQSTERGRNARRVHRILQELLPDSRSMHEGVKLPNGGTLSVIINRYLVENNWSSPAMQRLRAVLSDFTKKDNRIIASALFIQETNPPPTILVTKDVNVQLKARAVGLEAEDYLNDKVPEATADDDGYRTVALDVYEMQRFCSEGQFELADASRRAALPQRIRPAHDSPRARPCPAGITGRTSCAACTCPISSRPPAASPSARATSNSSSSSTR